MPKMVVLGKDLEFESGGAVLTLSVRPLKCQNCGLRDFAEFL